MKKNFISILILGCTIINIVLSAITMYSVVSTNQKTAAIVTDVANVLSLDLGTGPEETAVSEVPIENIVTYSISDKMTIELKGTPGDNTTHYAMVSVFFSMDSSHPDYKKYGETMGDNEVILKSIIGDVFSNYTIDEARLQQDEIRNEILKKVQNKYSGSTFVFDVSFSDIVFQ